MQKHCYLKQNLLRVRTNARHIFFFTLKSWHLFNNYIFFVKRIKRSFNYFFELFMHPSFIIVNYFVENFSWEHEKGIKEYEKKKSHIVTINETFFFTMSYSFEFITKRLIFQFFLILKNYLTMSIYIRGSLTLWI